MRWLWTACVAVALGCGEAGPRAEMPPLPEVSAAMAPEASRAEAQRRFSRMRAAPNEAVANGEAAMLLQALRRLEPAAALYERARALDPRALRWPYLLGVVRLDQRRLEDAAAAFEAALDIDPDYAPGLRRLGLTLIELGRLEEAREKFADALALEADDPEALYGAGRALARSGMIEDAIARLEQAVALAPGFGAAHYELGMAYREAGRAEAAARELALHQQTATGGPPLNDPLIAAIRSLRVDPAARMDRARTLASEGRFDAAIAELESAVDEDPTFVQAHINLLILYGRTGREADAKRHYERALELGSERAELHYNYGVLLAQAGRNEEAEAAFRKALEANPNHARSLHNLAQVAESKQRFAEAERLYRRALDAQPTYRLGRFHLGRLLLNQGETEAAIEQIRQAVEPRDQESPLYLYGLAGAYARAGNRKAALRWGEEAVELARKYGQDELAAAVQKDLARLR